MNLDPLFLSRIQFAVTVSFHIIFPSLTIGLSIWLAMLQGMFLATKNVLYQRLFDLWLKIFTILFAMGVVSGIVMAFQFGANWSVMSEKAGAILGPLLGYEAFTAFMLEATFLGVVLYARSRVPPWFYLFSCCMIALGSIVSSFWILCNNSWMQVPVGYEIINGKITPVDWPPILIPFFSFRIMVGLGLLMLALGSSGILLNMLGRLETTRWFLWCAALAFPSGFIAFTGRVSLSSPLFLSIPGWFIGFLGERFRRP